MIRGAVLVKDSAVRHFRRPRRVEADEGDRELAAIVANVPGAVYRCALDRDWTMEAFSSEIERISGYPASDFIHNARRSFASVIHPDDRDDVDREVRTAVLSDSPYGLEFRIVREDGDVRWVLERGQRVVGEDGQTWLHGVIFDVTERKQAEDAMRDRAAEQARIAELEAARARIIAAQDSARRDIERNLHDGAQQQLVTLGMTLRLVRSALDREDVNAARRTLDQATQALTTATAELRDLARGIHPAMLSDKGLRPALQALADRAPFPVALDCHLRATAGGVGDRGVLFHRRVTYQRCPLRERGVGDITVTQGQDHVLLAVADDGDGGAAVDSGSGLRGLCDRIEALGGTIEIRSDPGQGTRITADIPCRKHHLAGAANG